MRTARAIILGLANGLLIGIIVYFAIMGADIVREKGLKNIIETIWEGDQTSDE